MHGNAVLSAFKHCASLKTFEQPSATFAAMAEEALEEREVVEAVGVIPNAVDRLKYLARSIIQAVLCVLKYTEFVSGGCVIVYRRRRRMMS